VFGLALLLLIAGDGQEGSLLCMLPLSNDPLISREETGEGEVDS